MTVLLLIAAGALLGVAAGIVAGRWAWLALAAGAIVIYTSIGTGADVPPDWMATAVPVLPFAFIGVGIGIGMRRALHGDERDRRSRFGLRAPAGGTPGRRLEMSPWRSEAEQRLPELWRDETARSTVYLFLFELLAFVQRAHRSGDESALRRGYGFALWCFRQGGDLRTAAAEAFHQHLFDGWDIHDDVLAWLDPQVARDCWPLYEARLDADRLAVLRERLGV